VLSPSLKTVLAVAGLGCALAVSARPDRKKKEDETQVLQLPKELPAAASGETRRLTFSVTALSAKGLLSQQIRDALKSLEHQAGGSTLLHIRAFVAGTGDLRRVRDLVSETFTERHQPLPALSLIQAGGLPLEGAQVVLEGIAAAKKDLYNGGLAFLSPAPAYSDNPLDPVAPLAQKSLAALADAVRAAGTDASQVLRVTCYLSSLENLAATRDLVRATYPKAAADFVQTQRAPVRAMAACDAVAALAKAPSSPPASVAVITSPSVVLSGTQVSFGFEEADARLAFERLGKALEPLGVSLRDVAFARVYPLSPKIEAQVQTVERSFFDAAHPPAGNSLLFEGLASLDAGFAIDVVAGKN